MGLWIVGLVADVVGQPAIAVAGEAILFGDVQSSTADKAFAGLGGEAGALAGTAVGQAAEQSNLGGGGGRGAVVKAVATVGSAVLSGQAVDALSNAVKPEPPQPELEDHLCMQSLGRPGESALWRS